MILKQAFAMNEGSSEESRRIYKPGDWRSWQDRFFKEQQKRRELESAFRNIEWEPKHIWRSIWRYWFGGVDEDQHLHFGKLITIAHYDNPKLTSIYLFRSRFAFYISTIKDQHKKIFTFKADGHDFHALSISRKPFKVTTFSYDENVPSCG